MKEWIIAFNNAKTLETNGVPAGQIIEEYERVIRFLDAPSLSDAEARVWNEACRNLYELYALQGDDDEAERYAGLRRACGELDGEEG